MEKTEKPSRKIAGRKPTVINWEVVDSMMRELFSISDICKAMKISFHTIQKACRKEKGMELADYRNTVAAETLRKLANAQLKIALGFQYEVKITSTKTVGGAGVTTETKKIMAVVPDTKMLIHLGQQHLGQRPVMPKIEDENQPTGYVIEDETGNIIEDQTNEQPTDS